MLVALAVVAIVVGLIVALVGVYEASAVDPASQVELHLVHDGTPEAAIVVEARLGPREPLLMQVDTGFAGAPVVSGPCLLATGSGSVSERFDAAARAKASARSAQALGDFAREQQCTSYTAGCRTTAATAAGTQARRSELWQCDPLELQTRGGFQRLRRIPGEVVMGSTEPSPHMLTIDYLRDVAPCVFWMRQGVLEVPRGVRAAWVWAQFSTQPLELRAGAPLVRARVDGQKYKLVLDTGASVAVMLFGAAAPAPGTAAVHHDTHGKAVPSKEVERTVTIDGLKREWRVPVLHAPAAHIEGLIGLAILRDLDVYLGTDAVGFRPAS